MTDERDLYQQDPECEPNQYKVDVLKAVITYTPKAKCNPRSVKVDGSWSDWKTPVELRRVGDTFYCEL